MNKDIKKERIIYAAKKLLVRKGFDKITITELAKEAKISRGLLHYYFKNKEDILINVMRSIYDEQFDLPYINRANASSPEELAGLMTAHFKSVIENSPEILRLHFDCISLARQTPKLDKEFKKLLKVYREQTEQAVLDLMAREIVRDDISPRLLVTMIIALVDGLALQFVEEPWLLPEKGLWREIENSFAKVLGG